MANEYATLEDLKIRLQLTDTSHDAELRDKLTTASRDVDEACRRRFYLDAALTTRVYNPTSRQYPTNGGVRLLIDDIGDPTGMIVATGSASTGFSTIASTGYEVGPDNAIARGWPISWLFRAWVPWSLSPLQRVQVTALWGWPAVPSQIREACLLRAAWLFKRRESPTGVAGAGDFGIMRVGRSDPDFDSLIAPFVVPGIGGA